MSAGTDRADRLRLVCDDLSDVLHEGASPHGGALRLSDDDLCTVFRAQLILERVARAHEATP